MVENDLYQLPWYTLMCLYPPTSQLQTRLLRSRIFPKIPLHGYQFHLPNFPFCILLTHIPLLPLQPLPAKALIPIRQ